MPLRNLPRSRVSGSFPIYSWNLHFHGQYLPDCVDSKPVFEPVLKFNSNKTLWNGETSTPNDIKPVFRIQGSGGNDGIFDRASIVSPLAPSTAKVSSKPPWILFNKFGLLADVTLYPVQNGDEKHQPISQQIGSTENVTVRATICNESSPGKECIIADVAPNTVMEDKTLDVVWSIADFPHVDFTTPTDTLSLAEDFVNVRPILYIDQGNKGFILLAELVDNGGNRRILFSIHTEPSSDVSASKQHWIVSNSYIVEGLAEYTIRVNQDGDISRDHIEKMKHQNTGTETNNYYRYFEFWVNNLPLGFYPMSSTNFVFSAIPTKVGIGCWPTGNSPDQYLYFNGGISDVIFDPHDWCPGCS